VIHLALRATTAAVCAVLMAAFGIQVHAEALPRATPESVGMSSQRLARIAAALKEVGASLWTVVLQDQTLGGQDRSQEIRERTRVLSETTVESGGLNTTFLSRHGIEPAFVEVAAKLTNRYDVTFARPASNTPPSRIEVQLRDRALRLAAPRWAAP